MTELTMKICGKYGHVVFIQLLSHIQLFVTHWTVARQASMFIINSQSCSNSCQSSWWYHPTTSSSVSPFSFCPQSFPASGSFPISWLFLIRGQSIGASASASVYPEFSQNSPLDGFNMMAWWLQHSLCGRQHFFFFFIDSSFLLKFR